MSIILKGTLWTAHQALALRGFRWEIHQQGDLKLGIWRKKFREKTLKKPLPARLVFVPGFGDTPLSWIGVMTLLEPVMRRHFDELVMLDFPGYNGRLNAESVFPSLDASMDSLFDLLDSLKPHTVVGHSLGGFFAAQYAGACSTGTRTTGKKQAYTGLDSAISIDPSGYFESDAEKDDWRDKIERLIHEGGRFWRPFVFAKEPIWFKLIGTAFFEFISRDEIGPFLRSAREDHEIGPVLPLIRCRMAVVWGEHDKLLPSKAVKGWLKGLTHTREPAIGVVIRGAGHSPHIEAPATTAAVLGQLLSHRKPHGAGKRWYQVLEADASG